MSEVDEIRRELSDRTESEYPARKKASRPKRERPRLERSTPSRTKRQTAPENASHLAQAWYDRGVALGFDFPYDVNYLALALDAKISKDRRFRVLFERGEAEKVQRWVAKMIELWWSDGSGDDPGGYLTNAITARNAKDMFLGEDWEDVQEYARSCLRAAYLKAHGVRRPGPEYPHQQEFREALEQVRKKAAVDHLLKRVDEAGERPQLDQTGRERLRSWRDRRKGRK